MSREKKERRAKIVVIVNWILFAVTILSIFGFVGVSLMAFDEVALWIKSFTPNMNDGMYLLGFVNSDRAITMEDVQNIEKENEERNLQEARILLNAVLILVGIIGGVSIVIQIALNTLLTVGVRKSNRSRLQIWCLLQMIVFILILLNFFFRLGQLMFNYWSTTHRWYNLVIDLVSLIWIGISIRIIQDLRDEIKKSYDEDVEQNEDEGADGYDDPDSKRPKKKYYWDWLCACCAACC